MKKEIKSRELPTIKQFKFIAKMNKEHFSSLGHSQNDLAKKLGYNDYNSIKPFLENKKYKDLDFDVNLNNQEINKTIHNYHGMEYFTILNIKWLDYLILNKEPTKDFEIERNKLIDHYKLSINKKPNNNELIGNVEFHLFDSKLWAEYLIERLFEILDKNEIKKTYKDDFDDFVMEEILMFYAGGYAWKWIHIEYFYLNDPRFIILNKIYFNKYGKELFSKK